ncbi:MAG TPA: aldehyde dehydrogenase family protein, partial [Thermoanaerobaculia bacterium]
MTAAAVPEAALLVGGERKAGAGGARRLVVNPATGEAIASVAQATAEDVDRAARLADSAWRTDWKRRTPKERASILFRLAQRIREEADALALLES